MLNNEFVHATFRHILTVVALAAVFLFAINRIFPPTRPVNAPVAVFTPKPAELNIQSGINAVRQVDAILNSVNQMATIRADIFNALSAATAQRIRVSNTVANTATPAPIPTGSTHFDSIDLKAIYATDYRATQDVFNSPATHVDTRVTIDRVEVQPGRVFTAINSQGYPGIGIDLIRRGQWNLQLAGVKTPNGHIAPVAAFGYMIPHTQLTAAPSITFDHKPSIGITLGIHFGPQ